METQLNAASRVKKNFVKSGEKEYNEIMPKASDNRWHFKDYPDNILKAGYFEWKYFNFVSPGCSGIIAYLVFDPLNFTGLGGGRVIARFFKDGKILGGSEKFKPEKT